MASTDNLECDGFICLAEYNCYCNPVGNPVSISTMKRHRGIANKSRSSYGLTSLPRGPRYKSVQQRVEISNLQLARHFRLYADYVQKDDSSGCCSFISPGNKKVTLHVGDFSPPLDHLLSYYSLEHEGTENGTCSESHQQTEKEENEQIPSVNPCSFSCYTPISPAQPNDRREHIPRQIPNALCPEQGKNRILEVSYLSKLFKFNEEVFIQISIKVE